MNRKLSSYIIQLTQDACLKSFWYKRALKSFLRRHHVSDNALASLAGESKRDFLYRLFDQLVATKENKGHAVILEMARDLAAQTAFPDLKNVEDSSQRIADAKEAVHLLAVEVRKVDTKLEDERERRERQRRAAELRQKAIQACETLETLKARFERNIAPMLGTQEGGYAFQKWFYDLVDYFELDCRRPYKDPDGRQVDGAITVEGTTYLVELKFQSGQADATDVDSLKAKVEAKADNTMGIMLAISGYSSVAKKGASGRRSMLLLLDHEHLYQVLGDVLRLEDVILRVQRHASQTGEAYLAVADFGK